MPTRTPSATNAAVEQSARQLGANLTAWRKVRGLTAEQVADRAAITRVTLRKLEHGDPTVRFDTFLRVAAALGVLDQLVHAADPLESDVGRVRAGMIERKRIR